MLRLILDKRLLLILFATFMASSAMTAFETVSHISLPLNTFHSGSKQFKPDSPSLRHAHIQLVLHRRRPYLPRNLHPFLCSLYRRKTL